jgi:hypothetical protein
MADNPHFTRLLAEMAALHQRKNHDYASDANPFSNFEFAATHAGLPVLAVFDVMLGIKQARLNELLSTGKTPANESVRDNLLDHAMYSALRVACYDREQEKAANRPIPWVETGIPAEAHLDLYTEVHAADRFIPE